MLKIPASFICGILFKLGTFRVWQLYRNVLRGQLLYPSVAYRCLIALLRPIDLCVNLVQAACPSRLIGLLSNSNSHFDQILNAFLYVIVTVLWA